MGIESGEPVIDDRSFGFGFTNELGVFDTVRVLKNISGLWLVQESRRTWAARGEEVSYDQLTRMAAAAPAFTSLIDPDCPDFAAPGDVPSRMQEFCARTEQAVPDSKASLVRMALESLALKYRQVFEELEQLLGHRLEVLHTVGGGARNELLNQFTSNALNRPVVTGPIESTSAGNVLMQMFGNGDIRSHEQGREIIRNSFETRTYYPEDAQSWEEALGNFVRVQQRERLRKERTHHG
jgi:rhamnulokinase